MAKVYFPEQKNASVPNPLMLPFGDIGPVWINILKNSFFVLIYQNAVMHMFSFGHQVNRRKRVRKSEG
jgi:hypothetical protein